LEFDLNMKLVIVESPTKTRSLSKYLGNEYEIMASMGHIRDLPKSKMGIGIVEKEKGEFEFVPTYETMDKKDDQVRKLRAVAAKADEIILASDPDREGEAIAWHVKEMISEKSKKKPNFKRIAFHSITKEAILEALDNPREIDMGLVNSQQARRFLDRLVGYKLSPILWKKVRRGLSAGRVQSVAVRLIVEKEREIEAHKPQEYWQIKVEVKTEDNRTFWIELAKIENKKQEIDNSELAKSILADLESGEHKVGEIKKTKRKANPYAPF
jgi:DNA topoisomerase I